MIFAGLESQLIVLMDINEFVTFLICSAASWEQSTKGFVLEHLSISGYLPFFGWSLNRRGNAPSLMSCFAVICRQFWKFWYQLSENKIQLLPYVFSRYFDTFFAIGNFFSEGSFNDPFHDTNSVLTKSIKTFKASLYSSEKHFIFNNVLLMNRRLALKVFIIDRETDGKWIIKNKALVPWRALGTLFLIIHLPSVFIYYIKHWSNLYSVVMACHQVNDVWFTCALICSHNRQMFTQHRQKHDSM